MVKVWVALAFICNGFNCEQVAYIEVKDEAECALKIAIVKELADLDGIDNYLLVCTKLPPEDWREI